jgi:UDP-N-acetylmuramoylalanine--D-glutamate ligase
VTVADGAKVLVLGLGSRQGGVGVVRYLHGLGASVRVSDRSDKAALADALAALSDLDDVTYHLGGEDLADVNWADVVVRNPGVPAESPMLRHARAHGTPVEMEMTLFLRACPAPVIGVTGTKGKTTTTALLHAMVQRRWPTAVSAGNMGRSALAELDAIAADPTAPVSLELSSFQLESMGEHRMSPHVAVVTNIAPDHLDRYPSFEAYAETKAAIWRYQRPDDWAVLPADDEVVQRLAVDAPGRRVDFAAPSDPERLTPFAFPGAMPRSTPSPRRRRHWPSASSLATSSAPSPGSPASPTAWSWSPRWTASTTSTTPQPPRRSPPSQRCWPTPAPM